MTIGPDSVEGCVDERRGRLLLPYVMRKLEPAAEEAFEVHLLECNRCYEDLRALDRTGLLVRRYADTHPEETTVAAPRRFEAGLAVVLFLTAALAFVLGLALSPSNGGDDERAEALRVRAARHTAAGRPDEAGRLLEEAELNASRESETRYRILLDRADLDLSRGRPRDATHHLDRAAILAADLESPGRIARARVRSARIHLLFLLDPEAGRRELDAARAAAGNTAEVRRLATRMDLLVAGDYARASDRAGEAGVGRGLAREALWVAGEAPDSALAEAERAFRGHLLHRARLALHRGSPEEAERLAREVPRPDAEIARLLIAFALLRRGRPAEARAALRPDREPAPPGASPFFRFDALALDGRTLLALGRIEDGRETLRRAREVGARLYGTPIHRERMRALDRRLADPDPERAAEGAWVPAPGLY